MVSAPYFWLVTPHFVCSGDVTAQPLYQKKGILPEERVTLAPAFFDVGLDFIGPVYLKRDDEGMRKSHICVFMCMHSRAVHFELTNDITTEEFLNALKRFTNRHGLRHSSVSDNKSKGEFTQYPFFVRFRPFFYVFASP